MAMSFQAKQAMVAEVSDVATRAHSAVIAEYRGLTAGQMDALRVNARQGGAYLKVIKNSLAKLALKGTDYECMNDAFKGPVIIGSGEHDMYIVGELEPIKERPASQQGTKAITPTDHLIQRQRDGGD